MNIPTRRGRVKPPAWGIEGQIETIERRLDEAASGEEWFRLRADRDRLLGIAQLEGGAASSGHAPDAEQTVGAAER